MDSDLNRAVTEYARAPDNPELNYRCGLLYEQIGQTASAISYFLRTAERTEDPNLAYECLLKIGLCFERQGRRANSVRGEYKQAVCLLPKRPEGYFLLSRFYERSGDHVSGYLWAHLGQNLADFNQVPLRGDVEYPGKWGLVFEKSVSSWWWGKADECRTLLHELKDKYAEQMGESYLKATQGNLSRLAGGPLYHSHRYYNSSMHPRLRYKFPGSEAIERNFSQVYQDLFVLCMTDGKRNGSYLEIGAGDASLGSNSKLLEEIGWTGIGIEIDEQLAASHRARRRNKVLNANALEVNYDELCSQLADENGAIDYLQLDCEPSEITYRIMEKIPFHRFRFRVITYEHDHYVDLYRKWRSISRDFLKSNGYVLVVNDVSPDEKSSFEDWWAFPDLIGADTMSRMRSVNLHCGATPATSYMFPAE